MPERLLRVSVFISKTVWTALLLNKPELSRITDDEMKAIMLSACRCVERLLREKQDDSGAYYLKIMDYNRKYCRAWER